MLTRVSSSQAAYRVVTEWVESSLLRSNRAGEDSKRPLTVFLPPEAVDEQRRFPVFYCLAPWTSSGRQQFGWEAFREDLPTRLARLMQSGALKPCVVVCPDLYTRFGGSQYVNSSFLGPHADHIVHELIPFVEAHYPVIPGSAARAVFGRSSGGFGALRLAMDYPGTFAAVACHSGDLGFELLYRRDLVEFCYALARYSGQVGPYLKAIEKLPKLSGKDVHVMMLMGMAATYSPDHGEAHGFKIPIDPLTGKIHEDVWAQWMTHDPVELVETKADALKQLRYLYIDCGNRDQYHLHFGARQFIQKLQTFGVPHQHFEFDDNHSGTSYRYDVSLPLLSQALLHQD